ncbi:hypothetical protein M0R88_04050 [Halorussus gelatinilyticus]|uniref:dolichyl-phosphooligosaccharide-protein glycotransferase n=1 Tax=Halorussus gelatinilyticus TaxID=2937524 RepID=A0A8U0IJQ8_9EURY|nr:STT3 domain-containing protein [Halorussus gelatinilyticus]UPW01283.1 hypothetical protein M0R88_04050 [Halorussus gelatinilyticus]
MSSVREATEDLLGEKPDLESDLREVLAVDERADGWAFDDVPVDSGAFGELVSRDIVAENGDGYEVADPDAVRASLDGDAETVADADASGPTLPSLSLESLPSLSRLEAGGLAAALAFVLLMRTYIFPTVFRGEYVVLPSNDPYYYRYWVEQLSAEAAGVFDFSVLSGLPGAVAKSEPLMVGTLWWFTNLFGGADAAGRVLAWYPVVSALVVAALVYALAVRVTDDRRVGLASVTFLAVIPAFAYRTGLGFADHHAFDYLWLALTALGLVWLSDVEREDLSSPKSWLAATALGVAVAGQVMAWEAGPLLVGAVGVFAAVRAAADVRADRSPLAASASLLAGLAVATLLSHLAHTGFGWHTDVVAYSPALLLVGVLAVSLAGEAVRRAGMPAFVLGGAEVAGALSALALLQFVLPTYANRLYRQLDFLLFKSGAAETQSLFAGGPAGFFIGPILELGFAWLLAVPTLALLSWRAYRRDHVPWLVVCTYGWYFLVLAAFQRRFVGELAPFAAVLAGYGFLVFAAKVDLLSQFGFGEDDPRAENDADGSTRRTLGLPDRGTAATLAVLLLFLVSAGGVQTAVRHQQVKIVDDKFEAATWIDGYAERQGLEYPNNYVLSKWGRNRMYNYFVNGESRSYGFAYRRYAPFLRSSDPAAQYQKLHEKVGFVVTKNVNLNGRAAPKINYARFHKRFGSAGPNGASGAGHYKALYASDDGSVKVFSLVPGANVTGTVGENETVTLSKKVEIEGASFTYRRSITAGPDGDFSVTVPYAGTYSVGNRTVEVPESAVENGGNVTVGA